MKMSELLPYYNFYENVMKTLFHNFKSLYETDLTHLTHVEFNELWRHYIMVNKSFAQKITELKKLFPTLKQVWIHGDNLLMTP